MSTTNDARLNFRLPAELKQTIEQAAAHMGQSVTDYAVLTLAQNAQSVIRQHNATSLSNRDREVFLRMLDARDAKPNAGLTAAAENYKAAQG